jgi:predicted RNA-binding protein YlqC (UPF0109 family)
VKAEATLEFVARQLVDHPDDVRVETVEDDRQRSSTSTSTTTTSAR